jgi:FHS family Na+ dependent glucose MFS transporter 1
MNQKLIVTIAYYLSFIILGSVIAAEGPSLPQLAAHTSSALNQISLIFFYGSFGYFIGSFAGGRAYDRLPAHRVLSSVLVVLAICAALVPVVTSLTALIVIVLILGFAKGALDVGCNALLLWVHDDKVGPYMNGLHAFFGLGSFVAPLVVAQVLKATGDIHWVFWLFALIAVPIAFFVWILPAPRPRAVPEEHQHAPMPTIPVTIMVACFALYVAGEAGYGAWLYTYATTLKLGDTITAAYLTSAFWGAFTLGRLLGIWISTRLKPRLILYIDLIGCLISLILILLFKDSAPLLWIGSIGLGLCMASVFPTFLTLAEERMHVSGAMTGWFLVGASVGGMIMPWLIGQAFVAIDPAAMMWLILGALALNLIALQIFISYKASAAQPL